MRTLPRCTPILLLLLLLPLTAAPRAAAAQATITLSFQNGRVTASPDVATVPRGAQVRWISADPSAVWVVVFPQGTPFANGKRTFNGGGNGSDAGGPIPPGAAPQEHKYWVFYPDAEGNYHILDPKLVIVN